MSIKPIKYQLEASLYSKKMTQLGSTVAEQSQTLLQFLFHYQDSPQKSQTGDLRLCERENNSKTEEQESGQTVNGKRKKSRSSFISVSLSYNFKKDLLQGCYAEIFKVTSCPRKRRGPTHSSIDLRLSPARWGRQVRRVGQPFSCRVGRSRCRGFRGLLGCPSGLFTSALHDLQQKVENQERYKELY